MPTNFTAQDHFCTLSFTDQLFLVNFSGVYLISKTAFGIERMLYHLEEFYVEVFADAETGRVLQMKNFTEAERLDFFLDRISIEEITTLLQTRTA